MAIWSHLPTRKTHIPDSCGPSDLLAGTTLPSDTGSVGMQQKPGTGQVPINLSCAAVHPWQGRLPSHSDGHGGGGVLVSKGHPPPGGMK